MRPLIVYCALLFVALAGSAMPCHGKELPAPRGPDQLPQRLSGKWRLSLCVVGEHCWLRFQSVETREVHTLSRCMKGFGGDKDEQGNVVVPKATASGVQWDLDAYRDSLQRGRHIVLTVMVEDPEIYRGQGDGQGYHAAYNNCATFVRDAWEQYTGQHYSLLTPHLPSDLKCDIVRKQRQPPAEPPGGFWQRVGVATGVLNP